MFHLVWYYFFYRLHVLLFAYGTWYYDRAYYYRVLFDRDYQVAAKNRYAPIREPYYIERGAFYRAKEPRLKKLEYNRSLNMITEFEYNRDIDKIERELAEEEFEYKEKAKHIILQVREGKSGVNHYAIGVWCFFMPVCWVMVIHLLTR